MQVVHTKSIAEFAAEVQTMLDQQGAKLHTLARAVLDCHNSYSTDLECDCEACTLAREVLK